MRGALCLAGAVRFVQGFVPYFHAVAECSYPGIAVSPHVILVSCGRGQDRARDRSRAQNRADTLNYVCHQRNLPLVTETAPGQKNVLADPLGKRCCRDLPDVLDILTCKYRIVSLLGGDKVAEGALFARGKV